MHAMTPGDEILHLASLTLLAPLRQALLHLSEQGYAVLPAMLCKQVCSGPSVGNRTWLHTKRKIMAQVGPLALPPPSKCSRMRRICCLDLLNNSSSVALTSTTAGGAGS